MKKIIAIVFICTFYSCKDHKQRTKVEPKISQDIVQDTIPAFSNVPIANLDSINPIIKKELLNNDSNIKGITIKESGIVGNSYDEKVSNLLFLPKMITKGIEYKTKKNDFSIYDFYYSSEIQAEKIFVNIKNQVTKDENMYESFCAYFKPCGLFILLKDNRVTILKNNYCWKVKTINNFFKNNTDKFDEIVSIEVDYDNVKRKEVTNFIKK